MLDFKQLIRFEDITTNPKIIVLPFRGIDCALGQLKAFQSGESKEGKEELSTDNLVLIPFQLSESLWYT